MLPIFVAYGMVLVLVVVGWMLWQQMRVQLQHAEWQRKKNEEQLFELQKGLKEQFQDLSSQALHQSSLSFLQLAEEVFHKKQEAIGALVQPVHASLEKFDRKIHELETARVSAYASLRQQVISLMDSQTQLRLETANLVKALRSPNVRGRWGEMQLKRVVEIAGLVDHCDFYEKSPLFQEEKLVRPDLLVKLPAGKTIIVDAKTPLDAYLQALDAPDETRRVEKLKEHALAIRQQITLLSRKNYWEQFQPTPEFVVLFLPAEAFFSAALEQDPSLIEIGADQRVILATPTTLIALLRTVAYGWRQENLSQQATEITQLGRELYKRLGDMTHHWEKVGKSLSQAVHAYNRAIGSLESRVLPSLRRLKEWGGEEIPPLQPLEEQPRASLSPLQKETIDKEKVQ